MNSKQKLAMEENTNTESNTSAGLSTNPNNNDSNSNKVVDYTPVPDTPFTVVRENNNFFVTMGNYKISPNYTTAEEANKDAARVDWNRLAQVIEVIILTRK